MVSYCLYKLLLHSLLVCVSFAFIRLLFILLNIWWFYCSIKTTVSNHCSEHRPTTFYKPFWSILFERCHFLYIDFLVVILLVYLFGVISFSRWKALAWHFKDVQCYSFFDLSMNFHLSCIMILIVAYKEFYCRYDITSNRMSWTWYVLSLSWDQRLPARKFCYRAIVCCH